MHPVDGGLQLLRCDLSVCSSAEEALAAVGAYAGRTDGWVVGGGWQFPWFPGGTPAADLLDEVVGERPAYLVVADGHAAWVSTAALRLAGIDASTPDPPDGRIERLADGSPQGTLQEGAMRIVERRVPPTTEADWDRALLAGQERLLSSGVTAWQDAIVDAEIHAAYLRAVDAGRLTASVRGALWWDRDRGLEQLDELEARRADSRGTYSAGTVKLMLDGVCENFTASMLEPYAGTGGRGIDFIDPAELPAIVAEVARRGFQPHFHAIGDAAVRSALDAIEDAPAAAGLRPHVAHLQVVHPDDVPRFAALGVTANCQPLWACADEAMTELTLPFLPDAAAARQYPFADLLAAGADLAMGSDWPVSSPDVMGQLAVAVTRRPPGRPDVAPFLPEQRLGLADGLAAFTAGSARVSFLDGHKGTVASGMDADLVVLSADPFAVEDLAAVEVDLTLVGGELVGGKLVGGTGAVSRR